MAFIILAVFGCICALLAHGKGRSPFGWFAIGFIAPLLGIILVLVLPDQKANERRLDRMGQQNRRLRERLRQTRVANKRKLAAVNKRLNAHDRSLDMDTADEEGPSQLAYEEEDDLDETEEQRQAAPRLRSASRPVGSAPPPDARASSSGVRFESDVPAAAARNRALLQAPPAGGPRPPIRRRTS